MWIRQSGRYLGVPREQPSIEVVLPTDRLISHLVVGRIRIGEELRSEEAVHIGLNVQTGVAPVSSIGMARFPFTALALAVAVLGLVAAGCGNDSHRAATSTAGTPRPAASCKLDKNQRHAVALALADIRRLRRIEASVRAFSQRGAPGENELTGKVMVDLGSADLPLNTFGHLLHLAKAAVRLCGDCSVGLEGEEPFLGHQGGDLPHAGCG